MFEKGSLILAQHKHLIFFTNWFNQCKQLSGSLRVRLYLVNNLVQSFHRKVHHIILEVYGVLTPHSLVRPLTQMSVPEGGVFK